MNRRRYISVLLMGVLAASPAALSGADEKDRPAALPVAELIADLDSDSYSEREQATRALVDVGAPAVDPLMKVAKQGSLEAGTRAFRILQELYTGAADKEAEFAADAALELLAEDSPPKLAARAKQILDRFYELREQRALAHIKRLGGVINDDAKNFPPNTNRIIIGGNRFNRLPNPDPQEKLISYVLLGRHWKGGDDGLKYVRRLSRLRLLFLSYVGEKAPISKQAEQSLQADLPNLTIQHRGAAHLGIKGSKHARGCEIHSVMEGAAAEKAGLRPGDVITGMDDKDIGDFEALIAHIKNYTPGDKVKVHVMRENEKLTLEVEMGEWR